MKNVTSTRPPSFMSRTELAWELSISESEFDECLRCGSIPPPDSKRTASEPRWLWTRVLNRIERLPRCGTIYVVGFAGYRKIGYTGGWPPIRYADIQTGCPEKLAVFGESYGTRQDERNLHRRFDTYKTYGEWFCSEGAVAEWIKGGCQCLAV
jgi:hypothetical protein